LLQGEKFSETKKRLAERLQIPEKDWAKFRFALIQEVTFKQPTYINDGESFSFMWSLN
jgi:ubiquitin carboxyl-terminal hydrolase 7